MSVICLIGFMGAGKSASGKILSKKLNYRFVDLDEVIENLEKKPVTDIFAEKGEDYFRDLETRALTETIAGDNLVIACGGGIIERNQNINLLKECEKCQVIYLQASIESIWDRVEPEIDKRPKIENADPYGSIESLYSKRKQKYLTASNLVIVTDGLNPEQVADSILREINKD